MLARVTPTRRPIWPRIKARLRAAYLRSLITAFERDIDAIDSELAVLPSERDAYSRHVQALRVQLATTESET
jgi:hypothetical protein